MKKCVLILFFCAVAFAATAQKIVSVSGEYTYYAPSTMSLDEAKKEALEQTKLHVLEAKFGTLINRTDIIILENKEGVSSTSRSDVRTLSTHEVKGVWIEDTHPAEQKVSFDESMPDAIIIHTRVWGRAREIVGEKVDIDVALLKAPYKEAVSEVYKDQQEFFLYFKSPTSGYLAVYLLDTDEDMAYCLLPYSTDERGHFPVNANEEYILLEDYIFTTKHSVIFNHIVVVFSPNEFYKAMDEQGDMNLPRELTLKNFHNWLARNKAKDAQMIDKQITVQIVR